MHGCNARFRADPARPTTNRIIPTTAMRSPHIVHADRAKTLFLLRLLHVVRHTL
jgi:hypothetical protein